MAHRARFLAVDGEAFEDDYCLLADSDGDTIADYGPGGLHSVTSLEWVLRRPKKTILVAFGLNYDVNQWIRSLPRPRLQELWDAGTAYWKDYKIRWVPGRWFEIWKNTGGYRRVNEVFGFFQSSFVKALEVWGIGAPTEMERMKSERGTFARADHRSVTAYCLSECKFLVKLMDDLREACESVDIVPRNWIGAGSIANALLRREVGADRHVYDLELATDEVVETAILGSYFGGRVELLRQGIFPQVNTADLRSAYPSAAVDLPDLVGASLVWRKRYTPGHGIWRCRWDLGSSPPAVCPFPVRHKFSIYYPSKGQGWYHGVEVQAAMDAGYPIVVDGGYTLRQVKGSTAKPFGWVPKLYTERARLKSEGHPSEKVVKLALNSVYGKLAQGVGFGGSRPSWQSYFWAGMITAGTRAKMLTVASRLADPLMVSTDGIFHTGSSPVKDTAKLGGWELGSLARMFTAQPGVYQGLDPDGAEILKSRGFFAREVDYDALRETWEHEGHEGIYTYTSRRFVGLGVALARKDFTVWRTWPEERRAISLIPERKVPQADGRLFPIRTQLDSDPYQPKVSLLDARAIDYLQGMEQPMKGDI